jgi:hypothetical protein
VGRAERARPSPTVLRRVVIALAAIVGLAVAYGVAHWALIEVGRESWVRNLEARPIVEVTRLGATHRYRATAVPGPHPRIHELVRAKYGVADRWVRFVGADRETTLVVRLEQVSGE